MQALTTILPKGYSFHIDYRKKDQKLPVKKKTPDELLLAAAMEFKPKVSTSSHAIQQVQPVQKKTVTKQ
jgi:hypothetical protein